MVHPKNECNVRSFLLQPISIDCFSYLVLYLLFAHNVLNSNGTLRWQDVEDFLSQCGDHPPEELDAIFQNVKIILIDKFRIKIYLA
jgi:hypothetical protein